MSSRLFQRAYSNSLLFNKGWILLPSASKSVQRREEGRLRHAADPRCASPALRKASLVKKRLRGKTGKKTLGWGNWVHKWKVWVTVLIRWRDHFPLIKSQVSWHEMAKNKKRPRNRIRFICCASNYVIHYFWYSLLHIDTFRSTQRGVKMLIVRPLLQPQHPANRPVDVWFFFLLGN